MRVALVWSGDENSVLMFGKVKEIFKVSFLLTFLQEEPSDVGCLLAIKRQSEEFGVPFFWARVDAPCLEECIETMAELKQDYGIEGIVTNCDPASWIEDACKAIGMEMIKA
jgi:diphthamide synthase (EF-2-diphthine--ammonia ligase)